MNITETRRLLSHLEHYQCTSIISASPGISLHLAPKTGQKINYCAIMSAILYFKMATFYDNKQHEKGHYHPHCE